MCLKNINLSFFIPILKSSICLIKLYSIVSVKYERIKFLVIAMSDSIEIYAWAPKPYHKFMAFKVGYLFTVCIDMSNVTLTFHDAKKYFNLYIYIHTHTCIYMSVCACVA